jgi:hypothetical protein
MLASRASDHSSDPMSYTPTPGLGSWIPTPPAFAPALEAGWGRVTPFLLEVGSQLRPPPPPTAGSDAYVPDYLEIVGIGAANSTTRTAAQTEAARFWGATAPQNWNQVVRQLTVARGMNAAVDAPGCFSSLRDADDGGLLRHCAGTPNVRALLNPGHRIRCQSRDDESASPHADALSFSPAYRVASRN